MDVIFYLTLQAGQAELIALEKALKENMVPAGNAREVTPITPQIIIAILLFFIII